MPNGKEEEERRERDEERWRKIDRYDAEMQRQRDIRERELQRQRDICERGLQRQATEERWHEFYHGAFPPGFVHAMVECYRKMWSELPEAHQLHAILERYRRAEETGADSRTDEGTEAARAIANNGPEAFHIE